MSKTQDREAPGPAEIRIFH